MRTEAKESYMRMTDERVQQEITLVIEAAYKMSSDVGEEVERVLEDGRKRPLSREEACSLLTRVVEVLRAGARKRGDTVAERALEGDMEEFINQVISARERVTPPDQGQGVRGRRSRLRLQSHNGIEACPVRPNPCFHGREVAMYSGFVKTTDIDLWENNARLDIHLGQFEHVHGRQPTSPELLDIMLSNMKIQGVTDGDQFKIVQLARSIATNGVQRPPILDVHGALLDGNRRVAACHYVLSSDEFDLEQKQRVEYLFVWQLTEHATNDDRDAVVVSLNFEEDCKMQWPDYVKARKVYEMWQGMVSLEPRSPNPQRQAEMKRVLSKKFALGPDTTAVNRYLKMVGWANEFEDYHINERTRDLYEVKHRANEYFQYFDEISKGTKAGGVAYALTQDDGFRNTVFDLLFDGKFKSWKEIRDLKYIYDNEEARELLAKARNEEDLSLADEHLENAIAVARTKRAEAREVGANTRIESFVKWLEELPVRAFRDQIRQDNLQRLLSALRLVEKHAKTVTEGGADNLVGADG